MSISEAGALRLLDELIRKPGADLVALPATWNQLVGAVSKAIAPPSAPRPRKRRRNTARRHDLSLTPPLQVLPAVLEAPEVIIEPAPPPPAIAPAPASTSASWSCPVCMRKHRGDDRLCSDACRERAAIPANVLAADLKGWRKRGSR